MRVKTSSLLFYISFGLIYAGVLFEKTAISFAGSLKGICYIGAIAIIIVNFLYEYKLKYFKAKNIKRWIILLVLTVVLLLTIKTRDFYLFLILILGLIACNFDDKEMNKIINVSIYMCGVFGVFIPLLCIVNIIPNLNTIRGFGESSRYAYGFNHSQVFPLIFAYMVFMIYTNSKKIRFSNFVIIQVLTILVYRCFDSRNALLTTEFFYMIHFLFGIIRKVKDNGIIYKIGQLFIYLSTIGSFAILVLFMKGNQLAIDIDYILSHRFREPAWYFINGYKDYFKFRSYNEYYALQQVVNKGVDNTYFYIVIRYGIPVLVLFCLFYNMAFRFCMRQNNILMCEVLSVVAVSIILTNSITSYFLPFMIIASREVWLFVQGRIKRVEQVIDRWSMERSL